MFKLPHSYQGLTISELPSNSIFYVLNSIAKTTKKNLIFVANNDIEAQRIYNILNTKNFAVTPLLFPAWDCLPYDRVSPNIQITNARLASLEQLANSNTNQYVVITTVNAILTKLLPQEVIKAARLDLMIGNEYKISDLARFLIANSYLRVVQVNEPGEFSIKGSIVEIFPTNAQNPVRLDFFADKLEAIREFDPITQLSYNKIDKVTLTAAHEVILNQENINCFRAKYRENFTVDYQNDQLYESISTGRIFPGMEHWLPYFYQKNLVSLLDYVKEPLLIYNQHFQLAAEERLKAIEDYYQSRKALVKLPDQEIYHPIKPELLYFNKQEIEQLKTFESHIIFDNYSSVANFAIESRIKNCPNFYEISRAKKQPVFISLKEELTKKIALNSKIKIYLCAHNEITLQRMKDIFLEYNIPEYGAVYNMQEINFLKIALEQGFYDNQVFYISEQDLFGSKVIRAESKKRKAEKLILEASAIAIGEYIVHKEHGVGKFLGLKLLTVGVAEHEFICLEYQNNDKLYLPVENLDLISRYGSNSDLVKLDKLGSGSFQEKKARLKKRIKDIAKDLLKLASIRALKKSQNFVVDENMLQEFAASFPYQETEDQISAINDVKEDLSSGSTMDRLICGDVGFGKTEVAIRAAFIVLTAAVTKEKPQIAIIVPTTLLARQHFKNFSERFKDYGFNIKQLSRLVSANESKKTREDLALGAIDVVIGTHALLAKNIRFKNLTLAIIDEEQHFGVSQKEKIKSLRENIHVLTLSATPIPRTLQMSLGGLRDLSLIATPPIDRMAVRSFVLPFDAMVIKDAIMREYYRSGRIFYVCPRVKDLEIEAEKLRKLVPEVKFVIAHGGLQPAKLDQIMNDFCDGKYDLLLSTSIVESGIDIALANTIIINQADKFGLAQLYQLRGRVGRGKIRAYAYFTYGPRKNLTDNAEKRLQVMQTLDGLGAGFSLASHDMDIRGAGNLLGEQQSGHIVEVGVELYQNMLASAIAELKEQQIVEKNANSHILEDFSPIVNLGMSVLIAEAYIADVNMRLEFYRRIANLQTREEADKLLFELEDRFGSIPKEAENLVEIVNLKNKCKNCYIEKLDVGPKAVVISFYKDNFPNTENLMNYVLANKLTTKVRNDNKLVINILSDQNNRLKIVNNILTEILALI
ncbi:MAG: transcription-repair coupling factor [Rickettsiales bacterium]